ncbi:hypothetical protein [uncultured Jatrophihabitans sp.]|uniref:hypothetical protein n=1 Tax=uncultured Jatrophihabitans sp. TaxID=1610747 RepID=UPI0035CACFCE
MDAVLHRLEALPGDGRWAVTFRRGDGSEQTAVVQITDADTVDVAEASLPTDWTRSCDAWLAAADALRALERSRVASAPSGAVLRDPDGGWDVSLGNVVLGPNGRPACIAHGELTAAGDRWTCPECGAVAVFG